MGVEREFTLHEFRVAVMGGMFAKVRIVSSASSFHVEATTRNEGCATLMLSRKRRHRREFGNPAAALAVLRGIGVTAVEVEMKYWDLDIAALSMRMRPDVTARRLRDKRNIEAVYFRRPLETGEVTRQSELDKLWDAKAKRAFL